MKREVTDVLPQEILNRIKGIEIKARHLVNTTFTGEYQSAFKGRGMEFEEVREYTPGDDIRSIDWNVTARSMRPHVKIFRDERELTVMFAVDVSASTHFGSRDKMKNEIAAEIAALLSYLALQNNDRVGLLFFSDHVEHYIAPDKGRGHVWRLIREILSYETKATRTDLSAPLEFINKVISNRAIVFYISDFISDLSNDRFEKTIKVSAKHHELTAITLTDPFEKEIGNLGYIEVEDKETGDLLLINSADKNLVKKISKNFSERRAKLLQLFKRADVDHIDVETTGDYLDPVIRYFKTKKRGRKS